MELYGFVYYRCRSSWMFMAQKTHPIKALVVQEIGSLCSAAMKGNAWGKAL